jgi:hypothetical protein
MEHVHSAGFWICVAGWFVTGIFAWAFIGELPDKRVEVAEDENRQQLFKRRAWYTSPLSIAFAAGVYLQDKKGLYIFIFVAQVFICALTYWYSLTHPSSRKKPNLVKKASS